MAADKSITVKAFLATVAAVIAISDPRHHVIARGNVGEPPRDESILIKSSGRDSRAALHENHFFENFELTCYGGKVRDGDTVSRDLRSSQLADEVRKAFLGDETDPTGQDQLLKTNGIMTAQEVAGSGFPEVNFDAKDEGFPKTVLNIKCGFLA